MRFQVDKASKDFVLHKIDKMIYSFKMLNKCRRSTFNRSTKTFYSWAPKGSNNPLKNLNFTESISIISSISTKGLIFNKYIWGTIKGSDFADYLKEMINKIWDESSLQNEEVGILMDN